MIMIIGDINDTNYDAAKAHLIDTEKHHQIYHTSNILTFPQIRDTFEVDDKELIDLMLAILITPTIVYMLKSWEYSNDARLLHDYCSGNGYKIIYSKKF